MKLELREAGIQVDRCWLVRKAHIRLQAGSLTALVGPNGSGKTTLLRLLAGLWQPTEGAALLNERDLRRIGRRELARHISFVPQDTHLEFAFTVREVVMMGRHPHLNRFELEGAADRRAVAQAMERAEVAHLAERPVTELSGGERQRVIIARSLATEANVILLDEPTASLDIKHALEILDLYRALADEGKTIGMAIHDLNLAARYATDLTLVCNGHITAYGAPDDVLSDAAIRQVFGVQTERAVAPTGNRMFYFYRHQTAHQQMLESTTVNDEVNWKNH